MIKHILFLSTMTFSLAPGLARAGEASRAPARIDFNQMIDDAAGEGSDIHAQMIARTGGAPAASDDARAESPETPRVASQSGAIGRATN